MINEEKKKGKIIKKNIYVYVYIRKRYIYTYKTSVCLNFVNVGPTYCQLSVTNRQGNEKKNKKKQKNKDPFACSGDEDRVSSRYTGIV